MGWIEFIFTLLLPGTIKFLLYSTVEDNLLHIGFVVITTWALVDSHSNTPLLKNKEHNIHHRQLNKNYGFGLYIFDRLFGTYAISVPSHSN